MNKPFNYTATRFAHESTKLMDDRVYLYIDMSNWWLLQLSETGRQNLLTKKIAWSVEISTEHRNETWSFKIDRPFDIFYISY